MSSDPFVKHAHGYATGMPTPGPGGMPDPYSMAGVHQREAEQRRAAEQRARAPASAAAPASAPATGYSGVDRHFLHLQQSGKDAAYREIQQLRAFETRYTYFTQDPDRTAALRRWNPAFRAGFLQQGDIIDAQTGKVVEDYLDWIRSAHGALLWPAETAPRNAFAPEEVQANITAARARIAQLDRQPYFRVFWRYHALGYVHDRASRRSHRARFRLRRIKAWTRAAWIACTLSGVAIFALAVPMIRGLAQ